jgi:hypothetical protein
MGVMKQKSTGIVTKKFIARRTVLRGLGTTLALPLLDAMIPAMTPLARAAAAKPVRRLCAVYSPMGFAMPQWTPATEGPLEITPILQPLAAFKEHLLVVSGLDSKKALANDAGPHQRAQTTWLTGASAKRTEGTDAQAGVSMDQIAARVLGEETQLPSLELALEAVDQMNGSCAANGYGCIYSNTISWHTAIEPRPMEMNPRAVFERLFGDSGSTDPKVRLAQIRVDGSYLDRVTDRITALQRQLGPHDNNKLTEYLDAVRDAERRIQKAEAQADRELPVIEQPRGVPILFIDHAKVMFDLLALAYQTDLTRVAALLVSREGSIRSFPELDISDPWHPMSHAIGSPAGLAKQAKLNTYVTSFVAHFMERLQKASMLETTTILYGSGMSDSGLHTPLKLPTLVAGGGIGNGRHLHVADNTPLCNLQLTLLNKLGVEIDQFGDSTAALTL